MSKPDDHEREVLRLIILGHTDEQIARQLYISPSTVRRRVRDLMKRTGARNRHHLCALAAHFGWVDVVQSPSEVSMSTVAATATPDT